MASLKDKITQEQEERKTWENIADILTDDGKEKLRKGEVLGFKQADGDMHFYKVVKINRKSDQYYVKRMKYLYNDDDIEQMDKELKERQNGDGKEPDQEADSQGSQASKS